MKLTREEFLNSPRKAVTLVGMSGVGKSYLSVLLAQSGWVNFSCDYLIGSHYLKDHLKGAAQGLSEDNILGLSEFVGQVGSQEKGGLALEEFQMRQKMYKDAELKSLADACKEIDKADAPIVIDSTGSICELNAPNTIDAIGQRTVFVYLKVRQEGHEEILKRAVEYPKPLYYSPDFLLERLDSYKQQFDVVKTDMIDPLAFLRWVFPFLFEARLQKYQALADQYGVSIYSDQFNDAQNADDIIQIIAEAL